MNDETFKTFVSNCVWICVVMAPISLFRWRSAGTQALFLSGSFLALAGFLYALSRGLNTGILVACAVLTFILLAGDAVTRKKTK